MHHMNSGHHLQLFNQNGCFISVTIRYDRRKAMDISTISKECRRLSKLVSNLLLLARSDSNQIEMDKKIFELDKLLEEIVAPYKEIASYQEKK